jgi:hypothetical protein
MDAVDVELGKPIEGEDKLVHFISYCELHISICGNATQYASPQSIFPAVFV